MIEILFMLCLQSASLDCASNESEPYVQEYGDGYFVTREGMEYLWTQTQILEEENELLKGFIEEQESALDNRDEYIYHLEDERDFYKNAAYITGGSAVTGIVIITGFLLLR